MGTLFQDVYDSFFAKVPDEDFTYKADLVNLYLRTANGYAYKTVPEDLSYTLNNDDIVLYVSSVASTSGNITITINSNSYIVAVTTTDTLIGIANKINTSVSTGFTVKSDYSYSYPMLIITKTDVTEISASFSDVGGTGVVVEITRLYDGSYNYTLAVDSIELISLYMAKQHYMSKLTSMDKMKQHVGTLNFNKLPNLKDSYDSTKSTLTDINDEITKFRQEFYEYSN